MRRTAAALLCVAVAQRAGHATGVRRALDEEPAPPPAPLPPYPTVAYVLNVTRLNDNKPIISSAIGNSSTFTYNYHATWVPPPVAPDGRRGSRHHRRLDEDPDPTPQPDGLLLQVEAMAGGSNGSSAGVAPRLAMVTRSTAGTGGATGGALDPAADGGAITFEPLDPSKVVMQANAAEENFGVGAPSLSYSAEDERYYLVYTAASLNNRTQRLHKSLHFATSENPSDPSSWVRHGPVFDSYPFNTTETEYGTFLLQFGQKTEAVAGGRGPSSARRLDESPPPAPPGPHYLIFSAAADAPGQAAGLQVAVTQDITSNGTTRFSVMPNKTLLDPRAGKFDANGLIPGPAAQHLDDNTLLYLYNGLKYNAAGGATGSPWDLSVGYAILDPADPLTVLRRGETPILRPTEPWELKGRVANSVLMSGLRRVESPPAADLPYWMDQFVGYYAGAEAAVGACLIKVHCVSSNPSLQSLIAEANPPPSGHGHHHRRELDEGDPLDPPFAPNIFNYTMAVGELIPSVSIDATSLSPFAKMTIGGKEVERGVATNITVGTGRTNDVAIHLEAEDGKTTLNYVVHVVRASSSYCELSDLAISIGTLTPKFDPAVTEYSISYTNNISHVTVTPKTAKTADIKVDGNETKSGQASEPRPLASGVGTTITIAVTAQDGSKTLAYRIVAARAPSPDPTLKGIDVNGETGGKPGEGGPVRWFPTFNGNSMPVEGNPTPVWTPRPIAQYSVQVNTKDDGMTLTPHASAPGAQIKLNGKPLGDGAASAVIGLGVNAVQTLTLDVTAQDGNGTMQYVIDVARLGPSTDADLSKLVCSTDKGPDLVAADNCPLSPVFDPDTKEYFTWVDPSTSDVWVTPTARQPTDTKLTVNTKDVDSGKDSEKFPLKDVKPGDKFDVKTESTAQDTKTKADYVLHVEKLPDPPPPAEARLAALLTDSGHLTPVFASSTFDYTATVATNQVKVMPIPLSRAVNLLEVDGKKCNPAAYSQGFPVKQDGTATNITVEVLSEDKSSDQKYNVMVTYAVPNNEAALTALTMAGGPSSFTPDFSPAVRSYSAHFPYAAGIEVELTPTSEIPTAKLAVDGIPVESGKPTAKLPVAGDVVFLVTAESEAHQNVSMYSVAVHVDSNANLKALAMSAGGLDPAFAPTTFGYKSTPGFGTKTVKVTPTADDADAVIEVDGKVVKSGEASEDIPVEDGGKDTKITITCKSKDSRTTMTYTIDATNAPPSADASLKELALAPGDLDPKFDPKTLKYNVVQAFGTKTMKVTPTANGPVTKLQVNGKDVASGKESEDEPVPGDIKIELTAQDGKTVETYELTVTEAPAPPPPPPSTDATLKELTISAGKLDPDFKADTTDYKADVPKGTKRGGFLSLSHHTRALLSHSATE